MPDWLVATACLGVCLLISALLWIIYETQQDDDRER